MIVLGTRRAHCQWCKRYTEQELRVGTYVHIYAESWKCTECIRSNRCAGVVEEVMCFYPEQGQSVREIAETRRHLYAKKRTRKKRNPRRVTKKRSPRRMGRKPRRL